VTGSQEVVPAGLRVVAHGGGVQTTALLVLAATGRLDYQTFLFANVGDDSEHPGTLRYLHEIAFPYAAEHGLEICELRHILRDGSIETLYGRMTRPGSRSLPIPFRGSRTGAPGGRSCTQNFKIQVLGRWLKAQGASPANRATVALGISADEIHRVKGRSPKPYERLAYPLIGMEDGEPDARGWRMTRADCVRVIRDAGLPVPGKSACWFCPFTRLPQWAEMRRHNPALFERAAQLEDHVNAGRAERGVTPVFLSSPAIPLRRAVTDGQDTLEGTDADPHCDDGWCMT
jgi:hypothetical protein